ncbi:hypothetical protein GCM10009854_50310 [Saccharopolyspora halophila]|uniref:Uncharacterized protein n=1 Tax=Saccharopolyspora halophila TaxID=405551 RepID=A0ABN3H0I9_9PSEU
MHRPAAHSQVPLQVVDELGVGRGRGDDARRIGLWHAFEHSHIDEIACSPLIELPRRTTQRERSFGTADPAWIAEPLESACDIG